MIKTFKLIANNLIFQLFEFDEIPVRSSVLGELNPGGRHHINLLIGTYVTYIDLIGLPLAIIFKFYWHHYF